MKINSIKVKDFPLTNGANQYDVGMGQILPDLEVRIHREDNQGFISGITLNAQEGEYNIPLENPVTLNFPTAEYFFELYDDDSDQPGAGADDLMESIPLTPYQVGKDVPKKFEIKGSSVVFEIQVEYQFQ